MAVDLNPAGKKFFFFLCVSSCALDSPKITNSGIWADEYSEVCKCVCNYMILFFDCSLYIPFSGRNPKFNFMLRGRPKVLVLNKVDLCDAQYKMVTLEPG